MRRALLLDTETTGLEHVTDQIIEVGVCLFDLDLGVPLESYAALLRAPANPIEKVNRIPAAALEAARRPVEVWTRVAELAREADAVAAHNAEFDRKFVETATAALQLAKSDEDEDVGDLLSGALAGKSWCCTMNDFDFTPWGVSSKKLVEIALGMGLGVASAHRALADVDTMARIFTRAKELGADLPAMFRRAARPKKRFVAMVSFEMKHVAKEAGFAWDDKRREWWRLLPPEDAEALSFRTVQRD